MTESPLERYIQQKSRWNDDYKVTVEPIENELQWSLTGVREYGLLLVKNMFLINAGALVAAPAYATAMKQKELLLGILWWPICLFIAGLIAGGLCGFFAYLNFSRSAHHKIFMRSKETNRLNDLYFFTADPKIVKDRTIFDHDMENQIQNHAKWTGRYHWLSISSGLLSFAFFVFGCIVLMSKMA